MLIRTKRRAFAKKLMRFFRTKPKIIETEQVKEGDCDEDKGIIRINPKLLSAKYKEVLTHEFLHVAWYLDHNWLSRKVNYRSYGRKFDHFSNLILKVIEG